MTPVMSLTGIPQPLFDALQRAESRFPDVSWGMAHEGEKYRLLASHRGKQAQCELHECIEYNQAVAKTLDHFFEELAEQVSAPL